MSINNIYVINISTFDYVNKNRMMSSPTAQLKPILKRPGQIILEDVPDLVLCKPRLIPLKSFTLEKLEKMQCDATQEQFKKSLKDSE